MELGGVGARGRDRVEDVEYKVGYSDWMHGGGGSEADNDATDDVEDGY